MAAIFARNTGLQEFVFYTVGGSGGWGGVRRGGGCNEDADRIVIWIFFYQRYNILVYSLYIFIKKYVVSVTRTSVVSY